MPHRKLHEIVTGQTLVHVAPDTTVADAVKAMQQHRYSCLPVIEDGKLVGVFTSSNLIKGVIEPGRDPAETTVREIMTPEPKCIPADRQGIDAINMMKTEGVRHLVVTGCGEHGVAVVTTDDFPSAEIDEIEAELAFEKRLWEEL